jgi:CheY-like chemotaxis protein/anti-sigma regulatory factor (Ser/Thr protein kinase)
MGTGDAAVRWVRSLSVARGSPWCMTAEPDEDTGSSLHDRLQAVEDELRTPWTLLTAALEELAGSIVDVDGRAAIELARRSALRMQLVAEAFFAGTDIPDAPRGSARTTGHAADTGTRLRVLIADDNADLRAYLATMLAGKYAVDTVSDGAALVAAARAQRPDVIVSDARMPFIDGFEAARMLREDVRTADIPIVLLSGAGSDEAADAAIDAGVDDYLVKPFTVAELIARVDALARRRSAFRETADAVAGADVRTWRLLAAAAERFVGITRPGRTLDALGDIIVPALGDWYMAYLREGDAIQLKSVVHRQPAKRDFAWMLEREYPHVIGDSSPIDRAIAGGETIYAPAITPAFVAALARNPRHAAILEALQFRSAAVIPFAMGGNVRGAILVLGAEARPNLQPADVAVLERIIARAATAYHAAELAAREPSVTSGLQRALLPGTLPAVEGLALSVAYAPAAREEQIGGDWYDAMALPDGRVLLSVGDVVGHGLEAAVTMSALRAAIRSAARADARPGVILARVNGVLARDGTGRLATALVAVLEPLSLDVTMASAGHGAPAVADPRGEISHPAATGCLLGADADAHYDDVEFRLEPGSSLLLYTNGLLKDANAATAPARLDAALLASATAGDDLAGSVYRSLHGDGAPDDDVAILAVTASATLDRLDLTLPAEPANAGRARTAIARFLNGAGMADRVGDLLVAAGEAIGNAIEHAYHGAPGALRVRGRATADAVTVEVRDFGAWHNDVAVEGRGFGLPLMRAFADAVEVERTPFGTRVELQANRVLPQPVAARVEEPA